MRFRLESEMVQPVRAWLKRSGLWVASESTLPWGQCDLLAVAFDEDHIQIRTQQKQHYPIGSLLRADILLRVPDVEKSKGTTLQRLQRVYEGSVDPGVIAAEMQKLVERRFVVISKTGSYKRVNGWLPLHRSITAVELKLSRVNEVLHQASRNQAVANKSYVGLPKSVAQRVCDSQKFADFRHQGIGILGITQEGCQILLEASPRTRRQVRPLQLLCADRMFNMRIRGKPA